MKKSFLFFIATLLLTLTACANTSDEQPPAATDVPYTTPAPSNGDEVVTPDEPVPVFDIPYFPMTPGVVTDDFNSVTAAEWAAGVRMGWNLGNTLDSHGGAGGFHWLGGGSYANTSVSEMELAWVGTLTTRETIQAVADAGFDAIRIPVTWFKALDDDFIIREDWMARVQEIVDWSLDIGLKVMLNSHHDNMIFSLLDENIPESQYVFARVWQQIAYRFRDYDERLLFTALNEPRTYDTPAEWTGGTPAEHKNLNILNQLFVDIVRASGGNNAYRILSVPTYAASTAAPAQRGFVLPADSVPDRLAVAMHIYSPWEFALRTGPTGTRDTWNAERANDTNPITNPLTMAYDMFVSQGVPVILGEMGALNRDNEEYRAEWAYFFVSFARSLGMPSFWWDNGQTQVTAENAWGGWDETFGLLDRQTNTIAHPLIMDALMRATVTDYP
ncbi:MAG: glycoside hydrolase family 5 protein [Defluviitaleaceae bacterium]|nr:glycoside hydrolase family 5 protein [Defluviitaleaceae bacterium]